MLEIFRERLSRERTTYVILAINILFFIALKAIPNIIENFVLYPALDKIVERPWTLVTVFFSHEVHVHLLVNMALFYVFGRRLEKITSSKTVLLVYLISGFAGSLTFPGFAPLIGWPVSEHAVGASAAVFGVVAAFAAMCPSVRILGSKAILWVVALFIANGVLAISNPEMSIGAGAHAVGIVVGAMWGYLLRRKYESANILSNSE